MASSHPREPLSSVLRRSWQRRGWLACALWPASLLYGALAGLRLQLYRWGLLRSQHPGKPVVVVGNVIAGGAGKTPVVIAVVRHLRTRGLQVGVISRGYGRQGQQCTEVRPDSSPSEAGDEPLLICRACDVPVFVAPARIDAARALLAAYPHTDVIVSDDGLQHWALQRDLELCVFNEEGIGNGWLLPAGPLREPWPRPVDAVLHAGAAPSGSAPAFGVRRRLTDHLTRADGTRIAWSDLGNTPVHAVAAIARPEAFFAALRTRGTVLTRTTPLPDHYDFDSEKINTDARELLFCTEKDAPKLWRTHPQAYAVGLTLDIDPGFFVWLDAHAQAWGAHKLSSRTP